MWQAHESLQKRWLKQKHNKKLKIKIARLVKDMEEYAKKLVQQQWGQTCDQMSGNLHLKDTWHLLRFLLDPENCKSAHSKNIERIIHGHPLGNKELLKALKDIYLNTSSPIELPGYAGSSNPEMDEEISTAEVRAAMHKLRTSSAPGADRVTNKALKNLDDSSITAITKLFNHCWKKGELPPAWRHAKVTFIPKPGKSLDIQNLRPISLTSCLGKLFEHVILNRIQTHMEKHHLFPDTMIGFRPHLSTQDIMLRISEEVVNPLHNKHTRAILALDLTKAFDNIEHEAITAALSALQVGERTHSYIKAFLSNRTAEIHFGPLKSDPFTLGSKGTPQGSVLSPLLFNITLIPMTKLLVAVPNLSHSLYADDITLWTTKGSDGEIEYTLQTGADIVSEQARGYRLVLLS